MQEEAESMPAAKKVKEIVKKKEQPPVKVEDDDWDLEDEQSAGYIKMPQRGKPQ